MQKYAQLLGGTANLIIESEVDPDGVNGAWVACPNHVGPGWTTADGGNTWTAPAPAALDAARYITRLAFLSRFTDLEAVTIDLASIGATVPAASMRRYMSKVNAATFIDLDRADTRAGVLSLEAGGVLAAGRALVILDAEIQDTERYRG